jgi:hypothetical protein
MSRYRLTGKTPWEQVDSNLLLFFFKKSENNCPNIFLSREKGVYLPITIKQEHYDTVSYPRPH